MKIYDFYRQLPSTKLTGSSKSFSQKCPDLRGKIFCKYFTNDFPLRKLGFAIKRILFFVLCNFYENRVASMFLACTVFLFGGDVCCTVDEQAPSLFTKS